MCPHPSPQSTRDANNIIRTKIEKRSVVTLYCILLAVQQLQSVVQEAFHDESDSLSSLGIVGPVSSYSRVSLPVELTAVGNKLECWKQGRTSELCAQLDPIATLQSHDPTNAPVQDATSAVCSFLS